MSSQTSASGGCRRSQRTRRSLLETTETPGCVGAWPVRAWPSPAEPQSSPSRTGCSHSDPTHQRAQRPTVVQPPFLAPAAGVGRDVQPPSRPPVGAARPSSVGSESSVRRPSTRATSATRGRRAKVGRCTTRKGRAGACCFAEEGRGRPWMTTPSTGRKRTTRRARKTSTGPTTHPFEHKLKRNRAETGRSASGRVFSWTQREARGG